MTGDQGHAVIIMAEYTAAYAVIILAGTFLVLGTIGRRWFK